MNLLKVGRLTLIQSNSKPILVRAHSLNLRNNLARSFDELIDFSFEEK